VRGTNVDAGNGGVLDKSFRYPQVIDGWFINISCSWQVPPPHTEPISAEIVIIFSGGLRTASGHERWWRTLHEILIVRAPPGAYFISHYQGGSHGEWPKDSDEHAPIKTDGVICSSPKALETEPRPPAVERVSQRPKKLRAICRVRPGGSPVGECRRRGKLLPTCRTLFQIDVLEPRSDVENVAAIPDAATGPR
jgi:hypothetical protein